MDLILVLSCACDSEYGSRQRGYMCVRKPVVGRGAGGGESKSCSVSKGGLLNG